MQRGTLLLALGQLAHGGAFPSGRGSCNLLAESATSCRGRLDQHCPQILERCRADADCRPAADCVAAHDVASMAEARSCFPKLPEGDALVLAECLADCLPQRQPPSCLGRDGRAVDWWFMYKLPAGLYYAYHDAEGDVEPDPSAHPPSPNASSGALGGTLAHVFAGKGDDGLAYVAYNDQPPDGATILGPPAPHDDKGAHAKGVLATDGQVGFWLVHSSPKLPDVRQGQYSFSGSIVNGQTYLCLSLSAAGVEQAASQVIPPTAPGVSPLGPLAGCFLALGSGLRLVGTASSRRSEGRELTKDQLADDRRPRHRLRRPGPRGAGPQAAQPRRPRAGYARCCQLLARYHLHARGGRQPDAQHDLLCEVAALPGEYLRGEHAAAAGLPRRAACSRLWRCALRRR